MDRVIKFIYYKHLSKDKYRECREYTIYGNNTHVLMYNSSIWAYSNEVKSLFEKFEVWTE